MKITSKYKQRGQQIELSEESKEFQKLSPSCKVDVANFAGISKENLFNLLNTSSQTTWTGLSLKFSLVVVKLTKSACQ